MLYLIILSILALCLYIFLRIALRKTLFKAGVVYKHKELVYAKSDLQYSELKEENRNLEKSVENIIALYDVTKQVSRYLDEERIFAIFHQLIQKYLQLKDCRLIKLEAELEKYKNYITLPLNIDKERVVYLSVLLSNDEDKDKFFILAQQLLLGLKRAYLYKKIQETSITDSLTGVFSRRYLLERLGEEIERSGNFEYKFAYLMIDVDYFKDYNDRYGHLVGDAVLREVSRIIRENIRQIDLLGRYGGEEFAVILSETDKEGAKFAAERIRQAVATKNIRVYDEELKATISIGIAIFPENAPSAQPLIDKADQALYKAKQEGRNKVVVCEK